MNPLQLSEFFNFKDDKDLRNALNLIKSLGRTYNDLISGMSKASNEYSSLLKKMVDETTKLKESVGGLSPVIAKDQQAIAAAAQKMDVYAASTKALREAIDQLNKTTKLLEEERKRYNKAASETVRIDGQIEALEKKLAGLDSDRAREAAKLRVQIENKNKALKQSAKESLDLVSIYQKEVNKLGELRARYKDIATQYGVNSREAKRLQNELTSLDRKIKQVDASAGQFQRNVGNYGAAFSSLANAGRSFLAAFGVVGGVTMFAYLLRDTFQLIKESESLSKALKQVTETASQYASEVQFLRDVSDAYGVNLNVLTREYSKFYVATKNSSLAGQQQREIFETITKAGAVMALSTQDQEGALRALVQMISKGKVSAEELRQQLGERLPGAEQAMARVATQKMGVALSQFDKLLKEGKVITEDVLPDFAKELQKTFGLDKVQKIETLSAAQTRLTNTWIEFVKRVENGEGAIAKFTIGSMKYLSDFIRALGSARTYISVLFKDLKDIEDAKIVELIDAGMITKTNKYVKDFFKTIEQTPFDEVIRDVQKFRSEIVAAFVKEGESVEESGIIFDAWFNERKKQYDLIQRATSLYNKAQEQGFKTFGDFTEKSTTKYFYKDQAEQQKILVLVKDMYIQSLKTEKKDVESLTDEQKKLNAAYFDSVKLARDFEKELDKEMGGKREKDPFPFMDEESKFLFSDDLDKMVEEMEDKFNEKHDFNTGQQIEKNIKDATNNAYGWYDRMIKKFNNSAFFTKFQSFWDRFGEIIQTTISGATDLINQFFENQSIRRENNFARFEQVQNSEIEKLEERRDRELENESLTAGQKEAINRRYNAAIQKIEDETDRRRKQLQRKQAIAAKQQAIFQASINTAVAVTSALANPILAAIIGVLGAAQVAAIAAQPLPAFAKGTDNAPDGPKIVGEKGREMWIEPSGRVGITGRKAEVRTDIPKGSKILPHDITEKYLRDMPFGSGLLSGIMAQKPIDDQLRANEVSQKNLAEVVRQNRLTQQDFQNTLALTLEKENDYLLNGMQKIMHDQPKQILRINRKGQWIADLQTGNTIRKDVEIENSYRR